jgi:type IVB pilus formation R64 PilN family outer membrane protein
MKTGWVLLGLMLLSVPAKAEMQENKVVAEEWARVAARPAAIQEERQSIAQMPEQTPTLPVKLNGRFRLYEVLQLMADAAGKNLIIGPGVRDKEINLRLSGVTVERALEAVVYADGYGVRQQGEDLVVLASETRIFSVFLPPVVQKGESLTSNESRAGGVQTGENSASGRVRVGAGLFLENKSGELSYWDDIERNIRSLLTPAGTLSLNRSGGLAVVTDAPVALSRVASFMDEINARVSRQIFADIKLVEVELSNEHKLGIDWNVLLQRKGRDSLNAVVDFSGENVAGGGYLKLSAEDGQGAIQGGVTSLIRALEVFGRVEVVSQPRVTMLNNTLAGIQVGQTRSYIDSSGITMSQTGQTISAVTLGDVHGGVTLQLMGNIVGDEVFINVTPVVSMIDDIRSVELGQGARVEAPETSVKSMSSMVRLRFGQTAVIGGLITRNTLVRHHGVPVLGRLPFLGRIFSYDTRRSVRSELVIMLTPAREGL